MRLIGFFPKFAQIRRCRAAVGAHSLSRENLSQIVPFFFIFTLSLSFKWVYNSSELNERSVIGRWIPFPNEVNTI